MAKMKAKMVVTEVKFQTNDSSYKARYKNVKKEVDIFVDEKMQGLEMCLWMKVENEVKDSRKNYYIDYWIKTIYQIVGNWNSTVG